MQRQALAGRGPGGLHPHVLVMTATPIPRSLALTLYGDLDLSVIDELPPGRTPARTLLLREGEGRRVVELVRETLARGEQVYVVYPLVEESEKIDLRAATEQAERIAAAFPEARVDLVHGRLDAAARGLAMDRFVKGETQDPRLDHGDRGRRGRPERDADGRGARRALRARAAPPAARARGSWRATRHVPARGARQQRGQRGAPRRAARDE